MEMEMDMQLQMPFEVWQAFSGLALCAPPRTVSLLTAHGRQMSVSGSGYEYSSAFLPLLSSLFSSLFSHPSSFL